MVWSAQNGKDEISVTRMIMVCANEISSCHNATVGGGTYQILFSEIQPCAPYEISITSWGTSCKRSEQLLITVSPRKYKPFNDNVTWLK